MSKGKKDRPNLPERNRKGCRPGSVLSEALQLSRLLPCFSVEESKGNKMYTAAAAAAKSLQTCPTLCDPIDSSPLGSSVSGILHARILEWVAISFSIHNHNSVIKTKELMLVELQTLFEFANFFTIILFLFPDTS